ncbi:hypothetical protein LCGC14_1531900 [marine sediment metagenome]|uniref:ClpX-type ZB domain-containing protein n=1 Tax=marine sediment metagenome TaxID=412755 RepID=A0A0F9LBI5_9ZZZZ
MAKRIWVRGLCGVCHRIRKVTAIIGHTHVMCRDCATVCNAIGIFG